MKERGSKTTIHITVDYRGDTDPKIKLILPYFEKIFYTTNIVIGVPNI